jgi:translation initiation factor IF-2
MREKLREQARFRTETAASVGRRTRVFNVGSMPNLQTLLDKCAEQEAWELSVVVKADMQGTAEAVTEALENLGGPQIALSVVHTGKWGKWARG